MKIIILIFFVVCANASFSQSKDSAVCTCIQSSGKVKLISGKNITNSKTYHYGGATATPMVIDNKLYRIIGSYPVEVKNCDELKDFKEEFPRFIIPSNVTFIKKCKI